MEVYVTADITSLLNAAKTNAATILGAYATAVYNWRGNSGSFDPAQFFSGTVLLSTFIIGLSNQQASYIRDYFNAVNSINNLLTFTALAPATTQVSFERWSWLTNIANAPVPSAADLEELKRSY
jgi:hypothetical protein